MARNTTQLIYHAIRIEGGLIPAAELARLTTLQTPDQTEQTAGHYRIPKGLKLRDEVARFWKIGQSLWADFQTGRQRTGVDAHQLAVRSFLVPLLRDVLGFTDLLAGAIVEASGHTYNVGYAAREGRLPIVLAGPSQPLDTSTERFGELNPDTGKIRRRSPFMLAQEALNASDQSLWAITSNGLTLRILRDNPSLTRPAYIEVDLESVFTEDLYADFTAFWLLAHASRFGEDHSEPADCPWERWRTAGNEVGVTVRLNLRYQVAEALRALGTGFLSHPGNTSLRASLVGQGESTGLSKQAFFEELLRLVYRLIFLATVEDRVDVSTGQSLVFTPDASQDAKDRYKAGYSITWLRDRAVRRGRFDTHGDLWQALSITFDGLAQGQSALGLPALGGLYAADQCPNLASSEIENRHLLTAIFQLGYFRQSTGLTRVNYRDMGPEELGSVYESLLELVPEIQNLNQPHAAKLAFVGDDDNDVSTQGNTRKLTSSYYTPDELVQELVRSALDPVIEKTVRMHRDNPVEAVLRLTVCDPACGSGHFLLAAARRLADEVVRLNDTRLGGMHTHLAYRHALREVVSHCIFGVDKNPMAIQLAKTALWLEAYTPDRPLTFLDHHLRCGDALMGLLDEELLYGGIPEKAFDDLSGDAKELSKKFKASNRAALKAIAVAQRSSLINRSLWGESAKVSAALERLPDASIEEVANKRKSFYDLESEYLSSERRVAADIFVAAFALPKVAETIDFIPTSQDLWLLLNDGQLKEALVQPSKDAASKFQAFHWCHAFPQVWSAGGFDVVLGNPPWDQLVFREQEFFAARAPEIANAKSSNVRERLIEELRIKRPLIHEEYRVELRKADAFRLFVQGGGRFPLSGRGRSNTFSLFTELSWSLLKKDGRAGLVLPSGIATDDTTKVLFDSLVGSGALISLFDFENKLGLFRDIDSRTKFSLVTLKGKDAAAQSSNSSALFVFFAHRLLDIADIRRHIYIPPEHFQLFNPNTKTAPIFRTERDYLLTEKLYKSCPVLVKEDEPQGNPWQLITRPGLFNMSGHSGLFKDLSELKRNGFEANANLMVLGDESYLPVYEGKMVSFYDHRAADVVISETALLRQGQSEALSESEHQNPKRFSAPRHWVSISDVKRQAGLEWHHKWFLAWKEITSPTNERTLIPAVLPYTGVGHKLPIIMVGEEFVHLTPCLLGCLSSFVVDFVTRQKLGTTSLTPFTLKQLPILPPTAYSKDDIHFITSRVLELTYTADDLKSWALDLGYQGDPFAWNPERRAQLRAELDAYYARLYGVSREELRYILDPADAPFGVDGALLGPDYPSETFRGLKDKEERVFDEYRTRRLVLEAWDRLATEAVSTQRTADAALPTYSEQGVISSPQEGDFTGLIVALIQISVDGIAIVELEDVIAHSRLAHAYLEATDAARLSWLLSTMALLAGNSALPSISPFVQRLESVGVVSRKHVGSKSLFFAGASAVPSDVLSRPEHAEMAQLMLKLEASRALSRGNQDDESQPGQQAQGAS